LFSSDVFPVNWLSGILPPEISADALSVVILVRPLGMLLDPPDTAPVTHSKGITATQPFGPAVAPPS